MRVLYASAGAPFPLGFSTGAARSAHQLLLSLTAQGVTCAAAGADPETPGVRTLDCGYPVTVCPRLSDHLDDVLAAFRPDVVCTHLAEAIEVIERTRRFGAAAAWFIRNAECVDHPPASLSRACALGTRFFASSRFLADHMAAVHGVPAAVLLPPIDLDAYRVPLADDGVITMINPVAEKGLAILIGLILRLPARPFLIVEGWQQGDLEWQRLASALGRFPNVRLLRAVRDMREVYRQTRVLIVPSLWQEGFGRVVAEAQASGLPVIASRVGGLADFTAGTILVDDFTNPEAWATAVERLWCDLPLYRRLSGAALAHADGSPYRAERVAARFVRAWAA